MKRHWKRVLIGFALVLFPLWVFGDPPMYSAKEIRGQVVDVETGQPLEGAVVVADWKLYWEGIGSGGHGGSLNTIEVMTDKEGRYFIPGWGPRPRPPFAYLDFYDPRLRIFKSNYYPQGLSNEVLGSASRNRNMVRTSRWDGNVIRLTPFKGDWLDYYFKLSGIWSDIGDCLRDCPRLVLALDAESKRIKALAPKKPFIPQIVNIENFAEGDREFLKRFKDEK